MITVKDIYGGVVHIKEEELEHALKLRGFTLFGLDLRQISAARRHYFAHKGHYPRKQGSLMSEVELQANWEIGIEKFEAAVAKEKERLLKKKPWFPWRINITKL